MPSIFCTVLISPVSFLAFVIAAMVVIVSLTDLGEGLSKAGRPMDLPVCMAGCL